MDFLIPYLKNITLHKTDIPGVIEFKLEIKKDIISIAIDTNGYVNVTQLANLSKTRLDHWIISDHGNSVLNEFLSPAFQSNFIKRKKEELIKPYYNLKGNSQYTFMHPMMSMQFIQHCYPKYQLVLPYLILELQTFMEKLSQNKNIN